MEVPKEIEELVDRYNKIADLSEETKRLRRIVIEKIFQATRKMPYELTYEDVENFFVGLRDAGLEESSIETYASVLNAFFKWLYLSGRMKGRERYEEIRMFLSKQKARKKRLPEHLEENEIRRLIKTVDRKFKGRAEWVIIPLLLATGIRVKELLGLKPEDIDFEKKQLTVVGKGDEEDTVRVLQAIPGVDVMERLDLWIKTRNIKPGQRLFTYDSSTIRKMVKRVAKAAGLGDDLHPHVFRHTVATWLVEHDVPIEVIRRQLRHAKITTTQIYMRLKDKMYSKLTEGLTKIE